MSGRGQLWQAMWQSIQMRFDLMHRYWFEDTLLAAIAYSRGNVDEAKKKMLNAVMALDAWKKGRFAWHMWRLATMHELKQLTVGADHEISGARRGRPRT